MSWSKVGSDVPYLVKNAAYGRGCASLMSMLDSHMAIYQEHIAGF
jgi:hypothetical protein